jgi:hypothetical protein
LFNRHASIRIDAGAAISVGTARFANNCRVGDGTEADGKWENPRSFVQQDCVELGHDN